MAGAVAGRCSPTRERRPCVGVARWSLAVAALVAGLAGCAPSGGGGDAPDPCAGAAADGSGAAGLDAERRLRADRIVSLFENDTIEIQYAYVEALDDGRGYTAGRAGFTTATGDALRVVERYAADVPDAALAAFLPRLTELAAAEDGSLEGLEGYPEAWAEAAGDERFRAAQDEVVDELYFEPALARSCALGLHTPLGVTVLYDTIIQHGEGDDPDGLPALADRAVDRAGGSPATGVGERAWLGTFLDLRRQTLEHASDPETRVAWAESVSRVDILAAILDQGNLSLDGPIPVDDPEHRAIVP